MKSKVNKETRIGNTNKKKPFLNRQIKEFNPGMVSWVETPNAYFCKEYIPNNEENCCDDYRRKNGFPSFYIPHSAFETIQKRNQKRRDI